MGSTAIRTVDVTLKVQQPLRVAKHRRERSCSASALRVDPLAVQYGCPWGGSVGRWDYTEFAWNNQITTAYGKLTPLSFAATVMSNMESVDRPEAVGNVLHDRPTVGAHLQTVSVFERLFL